MDALALLCNLHADGPKTLHRLRCAGCESVPVLVEMSSSTLARELDGSEETALRFQREAQLLLQRLGPEAGSAWSPAVRASGAVVTVTEVEVFDVESDPIVDRGAFEDEDDSLVDEDDEDEEGVATLELEDELSAEDVDEDFDEDLDEDVDDDSDEAPDADSMFAAYVPKPRAPSQSPGLDRVLDTWRSLDRADPPAAPVDYELPRPTQDPFVNEALEESALDGLTPEITARLIDLGILSLRGLAEASTTELAAELPLAYTRARRLQFLANRRYRELCEEAPVAASPSLARDTERREPPRPQPSAGASFESDRSAPPTASARPFERPVLPGPERSGEGDWLDSSGPFA